MGEMTRGALLFTGAATATGIGLGVAIERNAPKEEVTQVTTLLASPIGGNVPLATDAPEWGYAERITVALRPQQVAPPFLEQAALGQMEVRALHSERELGVLLRFEARTPESLPGLGTFGDAVAMQLPLRGAARPPITMGGPGQPVHLLRWSSIWQRDVERGRSVVETIYPNVVRDVSPDDVLPARTARLYAPGLAAGNPASAMKRRWPVEEAFAEGFGSVTPLPNQRARAAGRHADDHWDVVLAAPLDRRPDGDLIEAGSTVPVAFALWLGSQGNRGSRKHYTDWVECKLA